MAEITSYETVQRWVRSSKMTDQERKLALLAEFVVRVEQTPDGMVADCLSLVQEGQFKLKGKTRRRYVEQIEEFENEHGGRPQGNVIRSFFIHNGIPIQPPILT